MKEKLIKERVELLLEGIELLLEGIEIEEECVINSLIRIDEDNYDRCRGSNCYYCMYYFPSEIILPNVKICNPLIKLYEVR